VTEGGASRVDRAVEALGRIKGLRPEVWERRDTRGRLDVLQEAENALAAAQGRAPEARVISHEAGPDDYGYYDGEANSISIGSYSLAHDYVREVVDTLAHESRHAYQQWAVNQPTLHDEGAEVAAWRKNMENYTMYEDDPVRYAEQPVEVDARRYARVIADRLYGGIA